MSDVVAQLRSKVIIGSCIDFIPYSSEYASDIVRLRNLPDVQYFLNQSEKSTLEAQLAWSESYSQKKNDIFWILKNKSGRVVGCNRLYDINKLSAEKGSLIVDPEYARSMPIALEADVRVIKIAFSELNLYELVTAVRLENSKMLSINSRFGFSEIDKESIRGVAYSRSQLLRDSFDPLKFETIINHWSKRNEHR